MFVDLVLVGQYESFLLSLAVILSLPVGLNGSGLYCVFGRIADGRYLLKDEADEPLTETLDH